MTDAMKRGYAELGEVDALHAWLDGSTHRFKSGHPVSVTDGAVFDHATDGTWAVVRDGSIPWLYATLIDCPYCAEYR